MALVVFYYYFMWGMYSMLLVNTLSLQRAVRRPLFPLLTTDATFSITSIIPPDALQPAS